MFELSPAEHTAHTLSKRARLLAAGGAILALAAAAAPAAADTLVYVKNGNVYVSQRDGTQARAITTAANGWAWPSETDAGIIAVAGGLPRISGTFNPSGGDEIYEFDQQGRQLAGPVPTQGSYSTVSDPEYVSHFRVAPDNSNVAWTDVSGYASPFTSWRSPSGAGSFSTAEDSYGAPLPYSSPEWWGPGHLLIAHDGSAWPGQAEYAMYDVADGSSPGWANDEAIGSSSSYQVTVARSGLTWAVMTDDGADNGGTIQNIAITLETAASQPPGTNIDDTHCTITLPAARFTHGSSLASMSFSADGSTLAWAQDDGIYEANVSDPTNCPSVTGSVHMVVPGGQMPFLGAAALSPPSPGPRPVAGAPGTSITVLHVSRRARTATLRFRGSGGSGPLSFRCKLDRGPWSSCRSPRVYKHLKKGKHTFRVEAVDRRGKVDPTPATRRFTV